MNITTDNYPEDITWQIKKDDTNDLILSGNPYLVDLSLSIGKCIVKKQTNIE